MGKSILVPTIFIAIFLTLFLPGLCTAGSLEPSGPPGPTMYTLEEILKAVTPLPTGFELWADNTRFALSDEGTPDHSNDIVLDRATGLMWTRNANLGGAKNWQDAVSYCDYLEASAGRGYALAVDWRLPSLEELTSLSEPNPSTHNPALPAGHPFKNVQSDFYWSATAGNSAGFVWSVSMNDGYASRSHDETYNLYVWCVRGVLGIEASQAPDQIPSAWSERIASNRFVKALDDAGVILDKETGLVWQKSLNTTERNWYDAQFYCSNLNLGWRKGWRVPTLQELASLLDTSRSNPMLPEGHPFSSVQLSEYWSATTDFQNADSAWVANFTAGNVYLNGKTSDLNYVWCVRGGQGVEYQ
jgi:hypothetical protein